jgi:hypothetical protein
MMIMGTEVAEEADEMHYENVYFDIQKRLQQQPMD